MVPQSRGHSVPQSRASGCEGCVGVGKGGPADAKEGWERGEREKGPVGMGKGTMREENQEGLRGVKETLDPKP